MLCVNAYSQDYIHDCRAKMNVLLFTYRKVKAQATIASITDFEPGFFNSLLLVLDSYFMHRSRGIELKDGNPLNEVRMLCCSILNHNNILAADKTIKYVHEKSVLKYQIGAKIRLNEADFVRIFEAFFKEIESKFTSR